LFDHTVKKSTVFADKTADGGRFIAADCPARIREEDPSTVVAAD
jgi:hypothetical protein